MKYPLLLCLSFVFAVVTCCRKDDKLGKHSTTGDMLLLCDDSHVDNWFQYRDSFNKYDVKITFYISHFHQMDSIVRTKLRILQQDGHEIGYHTLSHPTVDTDYHSEKLGHYLHTEIDSGMRLMADAGFKTETFAFPGGAFTKEVADSVLKRFKVIRTTNYGFWDYWRKRNHYRLKRKTQPCTFIPYGIDHSALFYEEDQWKIILDDLKSGTPVSLLFHKIAEEGDFATNPKDLMRIIREMHAAGIKFRTVKEFFGY